jgi:hypothetical protein
MQRHREILERHKMIYESVRRSYYLPRKSWAALVELNKVYMEQGHKSARLHCFACIREMLHTLYFNFQNQENEPVTR